MDCIFCQIADGKIPAQKLYEDDACVAFIDNQPQAPVHMLVIPRRHLRSLTEAGPEDTALLGNLISIASQLGQQKLENGFRVVINTGKEGGQTVDHLHVHVLGGRAMHWPPG